MQSLLDVSCIIITHNGASPARLPETLKYLSRQDVPDSLQWELIVVDNASDDGSAQLCLNLWPETCSGRLRVVSEAQLGQSRARMTGFLESKNPVVIFIDDDMRVSSDFIRIASEIMSSKPACALCAGIGEAAYESEPPDWFSSYDSVFSLGLPGGKEGDVSSDTFTLPCGGMVLRRAALQEIYDNGFRFILTGRQGKTLVGGEDNELTLAIRMAGWQVWTDSRLKFHHFLPSHRLTWAYLRAWHRALGIQSVGLDAYLLAFAENKSGLRYSLQRNYIYKVLQAIWHLLRRPLKLISISSLPEGDDNVIYFETAIGRLSSLLSSWKVYNQNLHKIANAAWRKKKRAMS